MLNYSDILPKKYIVLDGDVYEVIEANVFRKQKRKPVNQTKLRHLASGKVIEHAFHQSDKVAEADLETETAEFLYARRGEAWFSRAGDPSERFSLRDAQLGEGARFLANGMQVDVLLSGDADAPLKDRVLDVRMPIKVTLAVTDAPPGVKGNTAQGGTKRVSLESGAAVDVPLFIEAGDSIVVNTQTGEYVSRKS